VLTSTPVMTTAPQTATAIPVHARELICAPLRRASNAAQMGCVDTNAVALATLVNVRLGTQVPKCRASSTPAPIDTAGSSRRSSLNSARCRHNAHGASNDADIALRQKAMANAGATVDAINGPDVDTATMATTIVTRSAVGGNANTSGATPST